MSVLVADQCSFSHKHRGIYCSCNSTLHATCMHTTCTNKTIPNSPFSHSWSNNIIIMPCIILLCLKFPFYLMHSHIILCACSYLFIANCYSYIYSQHNSFLTTSLHLVNSVAPAGPASLGGGSNRHSPL